MKMDLSLSDGMSTNSDFSNDSHNSQFSTSNAATDFAAAGFGSSSTTNLILASNNTISFISLEGLNSGVPTRTTPTLTPTTLRSIEQTFIELQSKPETHENEAGFVPPMVHSIGNNQYIPASEADIYTTVTSNGKSNTIWNSSISQCSSEDSNTSPSPADLQRDMQSPAPTPSTRRNMGGRKPNREMNLPPEEEERRRVRRERNKAAAARCRKRRVDHTNQLIEETEELEKKKALLEMELNEVRSTKEQLEMLLEQHRPHCQFNISSHCSPSPPQEKKPFEMHYNDAITPRVKTEMIELQDDEYYTVPAKKIMLSSTVPISKPNRPNSLNVGNTAPFASANQFTNNNNNKQMLDDALLGIGITTPSTGMHFNFESLMVGGTGLTPVSGVPLVPNCSTQQRIPVSMSGDIVSPESCIPPKLVSL